MLCTIYIYSTVYLETNTDHLNMTNHLSLPQEKDASECLCHLGDLMSVPFQLFFIPLCLSLKPFPLLYNLNEKMFLAESLHFR